MSVRNLFVNLFVENGNIIMDTAEIVDKFNKYFVDIGKRLAPSIPTSQHAYTFFIMHEKYIMLIPCCFTQLTQMKS